LDEAALLEILEGKDSTNNYTTNVTKTSVHILEDYLAEKKFGLIADLEKVRSTSRKIFESLEI
jgi:hypothetical protein